MNGRIKGCNVINNKDNRKTVNYEANIVDLIILGLKKNFYTTVSDLIRLTWR